MTEGRQRLEWAIGCEVIAAIYNVNRGDSPAIVGKDINPFAQPSAPPTKDQIDQERAELRALWQARYPNA